MEECWEHVPKKRVNCYFEQRHFFSGQEFLSFRYIGRSLNLFSSSPIKERAREMNDSVEIFFYRRHQRRRLELCHRTSINDFFSFFSWRSSLDRTMVRFVLYRSLKMKRKRRKNLFVTRISLSRSFLFFLVRTHRLCFQHDRDFNPLLQHFSLETERFSVEELSANLSSVNRIDLDLFSNDFPRF